RKRRRACFELGAWGGPYHPDKWLRAANSSGSSVLSSSTLLSLRLRDELSCGLLLVAPLPLASAIISRGWIERMCENLDFLSFSFFPFGIVPKKRAFTRVVVGCRSVALPAGEVRRMALGSTYVE